ncbi:MAG: hypothetical protein Q4A00_06825 [Flavobacteriaceae bacterium]|nr:hypothetical protein [Flavobacteriaceae bacterium]
MKKAKESFKDIFINSKHIITDCKEQYIASPIDKAVGEHLFSFDLKKVYNLFSDYPWALSTEEKELVRKQMKYGFMKKGK